MCIYIIKFIHIYIERERVVAGPKSRGETPFIRFLFTVNIARIAGRT